MITHFEYIKLHARENFPNKMSQNGHFTLSDVEGARWNDCRARDIHWYDRKYENIHKIYFVAELRIEMHGSMGVIKCQCVNLIHSVSVWMWKWCQCRCPRRGPNAIKTQCIDAFIGYDCITTSDVTEIIYRNDAHHISARFSQFHFIAFAPRPPSIPSVDAIVVFPLIKCLWSFWFDCIR